MPELSIHVNKTPVSIDELSDLGLNINKTTITHIDDSNLSNNKCSKQTVAYIEHAVKNILDKEKCKSNIIIFNLLDQNIIH